MTEEWRPLPNFPEYIVSSEGRVAHVLRGKKQFGYRLYELPALTIGGKRKRRSMFAHRAVALAFHGVPPHPNMDAAHHDGNKSNNRLSNIKWKTRRDNLLDKRRHGRQPFNELHHWAKIDMKIADQIRAEFAVGGFNKTELAAIFGVSRATIRRVLNLDARGGWRKSDSLGAVEGADTAVFCVVLRGDASRPVKTRESYEVV